MNAAKWTCKKVGSDVWVLYENGTIRGDVIYEFSRGLWFASRRHGGTQRKGRKTPQEAIKDMFGASAGKACANIKR